MSPRIHPREQVVIKAELDLKQRALDWERQHQDLTEGEWLRVISEVFGNMLGRYAKDMIRAERHPDDPDKPGGWA